MAANKKNTHPKPFLRWAGGKRWLVKRLANRLDINQFSSYHEPFVGGGAMLFAFQPKNAFISDANINLMRTYRMLRDDVDGVIDFMKRYSVNEETYYIVRSLVPANDTEAAGKFIYLNRTSFNGIYRENLRGEYNVPWGKKDGFKFDYDNLLKVSSYLQEVRISDGADFETSLNDIKKDSLVFLDPPYTISKQHNVFIKYNQNVFSVEDLMRLSSMIDEIKKREAFYILTKVSHTPYSRV